MHEHLHACILKVCMHADATHFVKKITYQKPLDKWYGYTII